jgi:hypothetical protein
MRDKEHAEKRKREGPLGGAEGSPPRRDSRFTNDSDSASVEATPRMRPSPTATRVVTRSAEEKVETPTTKPRAALHLAVTEAATSQEKSQ